MPATPAKRCRTAEAKETTTFNVTIMKAGPIVSVVDDISTLPATVLCFDPTSNPTFYDVLIRVGVENALTIARDGAPYTMLKALLIPNRDKFYIRAWMESEKEIRLRLECEMSKLLLGHLENKIAFERARINRMEVMRDKTRHVLEQSEAALGALPPRPPTTF